MSRRTALLTTLIGASLFANEAANAASLNLMPPGLMKKKDDVASNDEVRLVVLCARAYARVYDRYCL